PEQAQSRALSALAMSHDTSCDERKHKNCAKDYSRAEDLLPVHLCNPFCISPGCVSVHFFFAEWSAGQRPIPESLFVGVSPDATNGVTAALHFPQFATLSPASQFDATPSLLGYLYQCRLALLLTLQKTINEPDLR